MRGRKARSEPRELKGMEAIRLTLSEKAKAAEMAAAGKSCVYVKDGKTYLYGDNPYIDQFIVSKCAQDMFPETFGPFDLSEVAFV